MGTKKLLLFFFCAALIFAFVSFSACGKTHTHVFKETVVAPTPTDYGYTLHTCEGCGYIYADNFTSASGQDIVVPGEGTEGLQFYPLDGDQYAVAAGEAIYLSEIVIPSKHNGKPVTTIADNGFQSCANLTKVTIPSSVTSIGELAFCGCGKLTSNTLPDSVTSIGSSAFAGCTAEILWGNNSSIISLNGSFYGYGGATITIPTSVTSIGSSAFAYCSSLTSVTIPNSVTSIGGGAFRGCSKLTSITIGSGVTSIGSSAFAYCSSLTSVTIGSGVTSIGDRAFNSCSSLTSVTVPSGIMSIGDWAFGDCDSLVYNEYDNAYYLGNQNNPYVVLMKATDSSISTCRINDRTKVIYEDAFYNCSSLTSITIPNGVTSIGDWAFNSCSSLTSIDFSVTTAQWNAISKGSAWAGSVHSACKIYCTNGTLSV